LAVYALASIALQAALPQAHVMHEASILATQGEFAGRALGCFMFGSLLATPVVLALFGLDRRAAPWWRPLLLGVVLAAALGDLAVYLHCPLTAPLHLLAGHATVVLPLALLWTLGRFVRSRA
jgi:hypothetical protein